MQSCLHFARKIASANPRWLHNRILYPICLTNGLVLWPLGTCQGSENVLLENDSVVPLRSPTSCSRSIRLGGRSEYKHITESSEVPLRMTPCQDTQSSPTSCDVRADQALEPPVLFLIVELQTASLGLHETNITSGKLLCFA
jgi:hypothetical protein